MVSKTRSSGLAYFVLRVPVWHFCFLTKSLIAILFPLTTFLVFLVLYRKINIIKSKHLLFGIGIFLVITLPWHIALYKHSGCSALSWMYLHEQVERFSSDIVGYNFGHPFYYMSLSLLSLNDCRWSVFYRYYLENA